MEKENTAVSALFKSYLEVKDGYQGGKSVTANKKDQKTYKLSSNENPIGASPKAIAAIRGYLDRLHLYPDPTDVRLRQALAEFYEGQLSPDHFIGTNGGSELIDLIIRGFVEVGDEVIISAPFFVPYRTFSQWGGAEVINVPLAAEDYSVDVEGILDAITGRTKVVFLTSPNNPTGTYIPRPVLERLLAAIPPDIIVVLDEVYWQFATAPDYVRALPYVEDHPNLIAINSFSKTYGLAALRVGYGYMNVEIADYLRQICKPFQVARLSLEAAIAALRDKEFVAQSVKLVTAERKYMEQQYTELGIDFASSQANFVLIDPPVPAPEFVDYLFGQGIAVRPMDNFGAPGKVRISIGTREANEALLAAIRQLLRK